MAKIVIDLGDEVRTLAGAPTLVVTSLQEGEIEYAEGNARRGFGPPWVPQADRPAHPADRLWRLD